MLNQRLVIFLTFFCFLGFFSCQTTQVEPVAPLPEPPQFTRVSHPASYDMPALRAIFLDPSSPKQSNLNRCQTDFRKISSQTESQEELNMGAQELILLDPVGYHWCFYWTILDLNDRVLKAESKYLKDRQESVLKAYEFLTPIAKAYQAEFRDHRYLKWAIHHYSRMSEQVFFRKLELTPHSVGTLVGHQKDPYLLWKPTPKETPILEKYGIKQGPTEVTNPSADSFGNPTSGLSSEKAETANFNSEFDSDEFEDLEEF